MDWAIALAMCVLCFWWGRRAGMAKATRITSAALAYCGLRDFNVATRTLRFSDGSSRTERP